MIAVVTYATVVAAVISAVIFFVNTFFSKRQSSLNRSDQNEEKTVTSNKEEKKEKKESKKLEPDEDYDNFDSFFSEIRKDVNANKSNEALIKQVMKRFDKVLMNTVIDGKKFRGLAVVKCFKSFAKPEDVNKETMKMCYAYGWALEMIQASFLIYDDMMDNSLTRRGQPCWYLKNNNGVKAIDDGSSLRLYSSVVIKNYCREHPCYLNLVDITKYVLNITMLGQVLDALTTPEGKRPNYDLLTEIRYDTIVKYKTSYYTFVLPIRAAMYLANITDEKIHEDVEMATLKVGYLFQAQDDYIDVFGDPKVTGKIGTDIEDGKCTWIAVHAYKSFDAKMIKIFEENYGRKERVSVIKSTFENLDIQKLFQNFEEREYSEIQTILNDIECKHSLSMKSIRKVLDMIYKRKK